MKPLFIDFEASGLHRDSYPIEVGWATAEDQVECHLIRPTSDWLETPWTAKAQQIHGIELERLRVVGEPVGSVAAAADQDARHLATVYRLLTAS